jgi:4-diphosphocytidyl-2-C-methyl-D-erythritol kinase
MPLDFFPALRDAVFVLVHPGFGISTPWSYKNLARFPEALNGQPGRARKLADLLKRGTLAAAASEFYNSLEAPALEKFPLLELFQEFFRSAGAVATLMSGSGSTTFALAENSLSAERMVEQLKVKFGATNWTAVVPVT